MEKVCSSKHDAAFTSASPPTEFVMLCMSILNWPLGLQLQPVHGEVCAAWFMPVGQGLGSTVGLVSH